MEEAKSLVEQIVEWTKLKCRIQSAPEREVYFREREIWWASIGANIGSEQNGKHEQFERPVLVLKKFSPWILWVLPITTTEKDGRYYYRAAPYGPHQQTIALSQIRTISSKRLIRKQRVLPETEFELVRDLLRNLI